MIDTFDPAIAPVATGPTQPEVGETLRCPKCGRAVVSVLCAHCGSRLSAEQADLYGAVVRKLLKTGGDRRTQPVGGGGRAEVGRPDSRGEPIGNDLSDNRVDDDVRNVPASPTRHDFKRPFPNAPRSDEYYTPDYGFELLRPYLPRDVTIWEGAWGTGQLAEHIEAAGYRVVGDPTWDFLKTRPDDWDLLCTNPPYSRKDEFLERAYALGKPFALLLPVQALGGGARNALFRRHGIELLIPSKRITFRGDACCFATAWFCWRLKLPAQLTFVEAWW
jgi:hypothetical protein